MAKILIVEDDSSLADLYQTEIETRGHQVILAKNGVDGLTQAQEKQPSLILLDIMLPKMNGLDVLSSLKAQEITKKIPVLVLTNFGDDENVNKALAGGAEEFILKYKIVPSEVVDKIESVLGQSLAKGVTLTTDVS